MPDAEDEERQATAPGADAPEREEMEIGATQGRTHEEVIADVIGPERARRILARDEPGPEVAPDAEE